MLACDPHPFATKVAHRTAMKKAAPALVRAVRPASLAASGRLSKLVAAPGVASERAARPMASGALPVVRVAGARFESEPSVCAGLHFQGHAALACALKLAGESPRARAGWLGLVAGRTAQRTMQAGSVQFHWAMPNPSIERTC